MQCSASSALLLPRCFDFSFIVWTLNHLSAEILQPAEQNGSTLQSQGISHVRLCYTMMSAFMYSLRYKLNWSLSKCVMATQVPPVQRNVPLICKVVKYMQRVIGNAQSNDPSSSALKFMTIWNRAFLSQHC